MNNVPKASLRETMNSEKLKDCRRHPFGKKLKVKWKSGKVEEWKGGTKKLQDCKTT
jgi:hypothetical protein